MRSLDFEFEEFHVPETICHLPKSFNTHQTIAAFFGTKKIIVENKRKPSQGKCFLAKYAWERISSKRLFVRSNWNANRPSG
uniref:Uncharacterized protein n=1 Tax=Candidatus Kentrum sp. TC TaxID=2126339 RepID=A0A450ZL60_9GAMM|nr:MAG: hypothetical protein BECKTC1821F_GA0114240_100554 [Candidatus Kentron sp. TC]